MAKEQKQEQKPAPAPDVVPEAVGPPKSYRLYIALGFVSLILFEVIVVWLVMPPKPEAKPPAGINTSDTDELRGRGMDDALTTKDGIGSNVPMLEKPLNGGKPFVVKRARNEQNETFKVSIQVKIKKREESKFDRLYGDRMITITDRVTTVLNAASDSEIGEVGLTAIKEKVKRAVNGVLGIPYVQEVLCYDISTEQQ
jgi:hypothetical protein